MVPKFGLQNLEAICNILADTSAGLTGSQLSKLLTQCGISHTPPAHSQNKRSMVYDALTAKQATDNCGNYVIVFIEAALSPALFANRTDEFTNLRESLNQALLLMGLEVSASGKVAVVTACKSLDDAAERVNALKKKLHDMSIHREVIKYCRRELLTDKNYFHSVLEASKGIADRLRAVSGCTTDGAALADDTLSKGSKPAPLLCLNSYRSSSEISEQNGLLFLVKGLFAMYRNPTAHDPKLRKQMSEAEALQAFQLISVLHHNVDRLIDTRPFAVQQQAVAAGKPGP
jgi:uncharacterized protein (TIGR02391 family)